MLETLQRFPLSPGQHEKCLQMSPDVKEPIIVMSINIGCIDVEGPSASFDFIGTCVRSFETTEPLAALALHLQEFFTLVTPLFCSFVTQFILATMRGVRGSDWQNATYSAVWHRMSSLLSASRHIFWSCFATSVCRNNFPTLQLSKQLTRQMAYTDAYTLPLQKRP